jgi:hypothetical protein
LQDKFIRDPGNVGRFVKCGLLLQLRSVNPEGSDGSWPNKFVEHFSFVKEPGKTGKCFNLLLLHIKFVNSEGNANIESIRFSLQFKYLSESERVGSRVN